MTNAILFTDTSHPRQTGCGRTGISELFFVLSIVFRIDNCNPKA
jgi:hypothetical protein